MSRSILWGSLGVADSTSNILLENDASLVEVQGTDGMVREQGFLVPILSGSIGECRNG